MFGITKVTLFTAATTLLPFAALQDGHGLIPKPIVNKSEWSMFKGTFAGYFLEFKLLRELENLLATCVAFLGGGVVRMVGVLEAALRPV